MELEEALRDLLVNTSAVTDLVGERIRPDVLRQTDSLPAVVIFIDEEVEQNDLQSDGNLVECTVEITALSESKAEARRVARAIKNLLRGYTGDAGDLFLQGVQLDRTRFAWVPEEDGSDSGWHEITGVYTVWNAEI